MELLTEIWDKTTDAFSAFSEGVSEGLVRLFGSSNERRIRQMRPIVAQINELEPSMTALVGERTPGQDGRVARCVGSGENRSTTYCPRRSPRAASRAVATSTCAISTSS